MFSVLPVAAGASSAAEIQSVGVPAGFAELARDHELVVDVYFGRRRIGETTVIASPSRLRFKEPDDILRLVPNVVSSSELMQATSRELPTNANLICSAYAENSCGQLSPEDIGVIFDEDRFRVDLFINPRWLRAVPSDPRIYLPAPDAPLSLTSAMGLALSGSSGANSNYHFQNRTILALRNARLRSDISYSSGFGLVADSTVAEIDARNLRYSAGLFWAPGLDLTGQRRILGLGLTTQLDTRADRDTSLGTPLVVFLAQASTVDILIDGRLVTSRSYDAGNNILDASGLPDGAYSVTLRIREQTGNIREEHRFFSKYGQVPPIGRPRVFGYVGVLANTRGGRPISPSPTAFYHMGIARRLGPHVALEVSVIGTNANPILEAGGWLITSLGRVRAAALFSPAGDRGGVIQIASAGSGILSLNFDLRTVQSHDGRTLVPVSTYVSSFENVERRSFEEAGSYSQVSGSIGTRLGTAYLSVIGSLRKSPGSPVDYTVGPNLNWPLLSARGLQVALQADAQLTRTALSEYIGLRILSLSRGRTLSNVTGLRGTSTTGKPRFRGGDAVGDVTLTTPLVNGDATEATFAGGLSRDLENTAAHGELIVRSSLGTLRGNVARQFEGGRRTQYSLNMQTGAVLNREDVSLGGRNLSESALVAHIDGAADATEYEVLVDEQARGRLRAGDHLPIFLQPYQSYSVRVRAVGAAAVTYDTSARQFTVYPGTVQPLRWTVERVSTVFGRAIRPDGRPVADAVVKSLKGIGQSNSHGYFQIEIAGADQLSFSTAEDACTVALARAIQGAEYASLGNVICR